MKGEVGMNPDILKGRWHQVRGDIRKRWGKLTDNDILEIEGHLEKMIGKLQERYGFNREEAEKQINEFLHPSSSPRKTA
jgi:uncharacterized protein YjbJ (UPF0337 family)